MQLLRGDANLGSKSELGTIGEAGGSVPINACGIDFIQEALSGFSVFGDNALAVARTKMLDVCECFVE